MKEQLLSGQADKLGMNVKDFRFPVDPALMSGGGFDASTHRADLPTPNPAVPPVMQCVDGTCTATSRFDVGSEHVTIVDTFRNASSTGSSTAAPELRDITVENERRQLHIDSFPDSDGDRFSVQQLSRKLPDGTFTGKNPGGDGAALYWDQWVGAAVVESDGRIPSRAKHFPTIPGLPKIQGNERLTDLLKNASVLDPATNADAEAWRWKLGNVSNSVLGYGTGGSSDVTFYDTRHDGTVGAYLVRINSFIADVRVLDVVQNDKVLYRLREVDGPSLFITKPEVHHKNGLPPSLTGDADSPSKEWIGGERRGVPGQYTESRLDGSVPASADASHLKRTTYNLDNLFVAKSASVARR